MNSVSASPAVTVVRERFAGALRDRSRGALGGGTGSGPVALTGAGSGTLSIAGGVGAPGVLRGAGTSAPSRYRARTRRGAFQRHASEPPGGPAQRRGPHIRPARPRQQRSEG